MIFLRFSICPHISAKNNYDYSYNTDCYSYTNFTHANEYAANKEKHSDEDCKQQDEADVWHLVVMFHLFYFSDPSFWREFEKVKCRLECVSRKWGQRLGISQGWCYDVVNLRLYKRPLLGKVVGWRGGWFVILLSQSFVLGLFVIFNRLLILFVDPVFFWLKLLHVLSVHDRLEFRLDIVSHCIYEFAWLLTKLFNDLVKLPFLRPRVELISIDIIVNHSRELFLILLLFFYLVFIHTTIFVLKLSLIALAITLLNKLIQMSEVYQRLKYSLWRVLLLL